MTSTRPPLDLNYRSEPAPSRRSISSQAASASRALTSVAASSVSTPYGGLPSSASSSSASSSSSLVSSARRSISSTGRNSFSRTSPSTTSLVKDQSPRSRSRRNGSASSSSLVLTTPDSATGIHQSSNAEPSASGSGSKRDAVSADTASNSSRHQRHHSAETLRLDLDGLDLGGNQFLANPLDAAAPVAPDQRHVRSTSNNAALPNSFSSTRPGGFIDPFNASKPVDSNLHHLCASCPTDPHTYPALHALEDSFSLHLRAECSDYRQIMPAQIVLNAAADRELRMRNAGPDAPDQHRARGYSISHGQVLGGFASLGLQTEPDAAPTAPPTRQSPVRADTKHSTDSSESPLTPIEWRDSFASPTSASYDATPKWAHLTSRPCNPLEPLDVLSIQEMGFHSLDVGSLNDWEGCKLSAEILCPINGHQRIQWSVAQTTRRTKKWVVVPNATITCGKPDALANAEQAERTVVVSERSIWLDEAAHTAAQPSASHNPDQSAKLATSNRSSRPFSGKSGFELRLLRPTSGRICPPVYLANASTHRSLHQYRTDICLRSKPSQASLVADRLSPRPPQPVYPVLRRSRSRPYLRHQHVPLRRSRSKPYLKPEQHAASQAVASSVVADDFAPSLPGDPHLRMHPGESWPSARSRSPGSRSSFDATSSSDDESDASSDAEIFSAPKTHESASGSASSASYDHSHKPDAASDGSASYANGSMPPRSAPVAMLSSGNRHGTGQHSPSDKSSATSWQQSSLGESLTDSWQGTSQTTAASASSASASSKQSRSRKGLQRALQKKDKVLNSWFKRRADASSAASADGQATQAEVANGVSPSASALPSATSAYRSLNGSQPARMPRESSETSASVANKGPTPLTETALESFQRAMFRPASPESTIMGSRRGSEALTQKAVEPSNAVADRSIPDKVATNGAAPGTHAASDNRTGVHTTLSALYGWDREQAASKLLPSRGVGSGPGSVASTQGSSYLDLDEQVALLGIDAVPAEALTMLIPLPLIGRSRAQDAVRYMRVNFVPFGSLSDSVDAQRSTAWSGLSGVGSPSSESEAGLSHSTSNGSGSLASTREAGPGTAKTSEQSNWKRKLGLSGRSGAGANGQNGAPVGASQAGGALGSSASKGQLASSTTEALVSPAPTSGPQAFRITAIVHDAPWTAPAACSSSQLDPRLPEPGTFPVVLGYCNGSKTLEMVPEGWGALSLAGVPVPTKPDGSPLEGVHPLHGVTDLIISACTAVMDV
ncbi:hypothetical protein L1887_59556 [Cichorium endivia]|nr:hypothetical protein L1887_59556 [Cichorium endivia]